MSDPAATPPMPPMPDRPAAGGQHHRRNLSSGAPWEPVVGYSRAVRVGPHIHVSGTTALDENGQVLGRGDPYLQARQALQNIANALERLGAGMEHVVRTRMYLTDIARWKEVAQAHGELFGQIRPATSMVEVKRLIDPLMLVEIEADAYLPETDAPDPHPPAPVSGEGGGPTGGAMGGPPPGTDPALVLP